MEAGTAIYPCAGTRDEESEKALAHAFKKGGWKEVPRFYRTGNWNTSGAGCKVRVGR
jgi:protein-L-isoaspartate(D-aspartate) O-methyltransferase